MSQKNQSQFVFSSAEQIAQPEAVHSSSGQHQSVTDCNGINLTVVPTFC